MTPYPVHPHAARGRRRHRSIVAFLGLPDSEQGGAAARHRLPPRARQGLTLIELLVAIAIVVLLVSVVFLVYGAVLNTIRTQTFRRENLDPAAEAMDALQRDLLCSLAPRGVPHAPFTLTPAGDETPAAFSLRLFTARPGGGSNDWRAYGIHEVEYALQRDGAAERFALLRRSRPFRIASPPAGWAPIPAPRGADGPRQREAADARFHPGTETTSTDAVKGTAMPRADAPSNGMAAFVTDTLLRSLAGMEIQVYDGRAWTNAWGTGNATGALPQAARVKLRLDLPAGPRTIVVATLIPAGHTIAPAGPSSADPAPRGTSAPPARRTSAP